MGETYQIYRERIPSTDRRLGRHIHHDDRSRLYPFDTAGLTIASVEHTRQVPIFDQEDLGSCTGEAGDGCLATDPYYDTLWGAERPLGYWTYPPTQAGAVALYSAATALDDYPGQWPPDDTGSDGLTVAKVLKSAGMISGYQHTFSLVDALQALSVTCFITGINWYSDMFRPSPEGVVSIGGSLAGGHEVVAVSYDAARGLVGFDNSWGSSFGLGGRFFLAAEDYGRLLDERGDVTIFTPISQPAPTPTPVPPVVTDADRTLAVALRQANWVHRPHIDGARRVARAALPWLDEKGL